MSAGPSTRTPDAFTSTPPVPSSALRIASGRCTTVPSTSTTVSAPSEDATAATSGVAVDRSTDTCTSPARSRRSKKTRPPRSRARCTQPPSRTAAPTCSSRSAPQRWVRKVVASAESDIQWGRWWASRLGGTRESVTTRNRANAVRRSAAARGKRRRPDLEAASAAVQSFTRAQGSHSTPKGTAPAWARVAPSLRPKPWRTKLNFMCRMTFGRAFVSGLPHSARAGSAGDSRCPSPAVFATPDRASGVSASPPSMLPR